MIVLADEIAGGEPPILPLLDVTVERNAFGRQLDSFEAELAVPVLGDTPVHAVFIRAPIIERTGPGVDVLARLDDGGSWPSASATSSPPRSTRSSPGRRASTGWSRRWPAEHDDPGEGSGRRPPPDATRETAAPMTEPRASRRAPARSAPRG